MGHQRFHLREGQPSLDGPLHSDQAHPKLVLQKLSHCSDTSVAQVVNVITGSSRILEAQELSHNLNDIFLAKGDNIERHVDAQAMIHFESSYLREVIPFGREEHVVDKCFGKFVRGWITRSQLAVNFEKRLLFCGCFINNERVPE